MRGLQIVSFITLLVIFIVGCDSSVSTLDATTNSDPATAKFDQAEGASTSSTVKIVTGDDIDDPSDATIDWLLFTRDDATGTFEIGPGMPPLGVGSFAVEMNNGTDKVTLFNYDHIGTKLADITEMSYEEFRAAASDNPDAQVVSLNLQVDYVGDGSSFTTLVFEPVYNGGPGAEGQWNAWDAYNNGDAVWWSTRAIPGVPTAFNSFVKWSDIVAANPNAKIKFGFGVNTGSGWNGTFSGAVDALTIGTASESVTYDFEPFRTPQTKDDCKKGGWKDLARADGSSFKNQGDCIQYVNTGK